MARSLCSVEGCGRHVASGGLCIAHHSRQRRGRPVDGPVASYRNAPSVVWTRVQRRRGCWEWQGTRIRFGYGQTTVGGERWLMHRYAWARVNGAIPEGLVIAHRCDNPRCVKPGDLLLTTELGNTLDMLVKGRNPGAGRGGSLYVGSPEIKRALHRENRKARLRFEALKVVFLALVAADASAPQVEQNAA
jgi:hypothetical protein